MNSALYYAAIKGYLDRNQVREAVSMMRQDWADQGKVLTDLEARRFLAQRGVSEQVIKESLGKKLCPESPRR